MDDLDPTRFVVHQAEVRDGVELAFVHERPPDGGFPLVLLYGWPETKRIWWRVVAPLADAGFEVIVPDMRGFGDSGLAPDGHYDLAAHARDVRALVGTVLGHERCAVAGGDLGGGVAQDLGLRFGGFVVRQVLFNTILPMLGDAYAAAGLPERPEPRTRMATDYFVRQGREAEALAAELASAEQRVRYVAEFYGHRFWAAAGAFDADAVAFHASPFADADRLRASFGNYESALGTLPLSEPPRLFERSAVPTLALYGPEDHVIWPDFAERCEVVFDDLVGPFVVPRAGHFLPWERPHLFVRACVRLSARSPSPRLTGGGPHGPGRGTLFTQRLGL